MTKANALRTIRDRSSRNEIIDARLRSHSSLILTQMDIYKLHLTLLASTPRAACSTAVTWFWSRAISLSLSIPSPTSAPFPFSPPDIEEELKQSRVSHRTRINVYIHSRISLSLSLSLSLSCTQEREGSPSLSLRRCASLPPLTCCWILNKSPLLLV